MDYRLIILGVLFLALVGSVVYLVVTIRFARRQRALVDSLAPTPPVAPLTPPEAAPTAAAVPSTPPAPTAPPAPPAAHGLQAPSGRDQAPDYRPIGPVELRFTDGSASVGVRAGSRTFEEFQRAAAALFAELRRAVPR